MKKRSPFKKWRSFPDGWDELWPYVEDTQRIPTSGEIAKPIEKGGYELDLVTRSYELRNSNKTKKPKK